jgi:hypothetical protein
MDQLQAMSRSIFACDARMVLRPQNEIRMGQVFLNFFVLCCACDARTVLRSRNEIRMGQGFMLLAVVVVYTSMMNTRGLCYKQ